jgi:hypothetical protein
MDDDFRVRLRAEDMALGQESFAQFLKVIDLAVEYDPDRFILIRHRLRAGVQINDGQAEMSQTDIAIQMDALSIGTTVTHGVEHGLDGGTLNPGFRVKK